MPRWDFHCPGCGRTREVTFVTWQQAINQPTLVCRDCGDTFIKMPAAPSFVLRGVGFHAVDYKKKGAS
jgi:predicted nucleic acid-binding Zn ribbon protein